MSKIYLNSVLFVGIVFLFFGCSSKPTRIELVIKSKEMINKNQTGHASPLMLNIFELKKSTQFAKLDYDSLTEDPKGALDETFNGYMKQIIIPSEEHTYKILTQPDTEFIGVVGHFRVMDEHSEWKQIVPLKLDKYNEAKILIEENKLIKEIQ